MPGDLILDGYGNQILPKNSQNGKKPPKLPDFVENFVGNHVYLVELSAITGGWLTSSFTCLVTLFWMATAIKYCQKMPKNSQNGKNPSKNTRFCGKFCRKSYIYLVELSAITGGWLTSSFTCLVTLFWMATMIWHW